MWLKGMGNEFSGVGPRIEDPRVLLGEGGDLVVEEELDSYKLFRVLRCYDRRFGRVVTKCFVSATDFDFTSVRDRVEEIRDCLSTPLHPHCWPVQATEVHSDRVALLIRPFFECSLSDRYSMFFLTPS